MIAVGGWARDGRGWVCACDGEVWGGAEGADGVEVVCARDGGVRA